MNKKTSSIARRINWAWTVKRLTTFFLTDIIVIVMMVMGWFYATEVDYFGEFQQNAHRVFYVASESYGEIVIGEEEQVALDDMALLEVIDGLSYKASYVGIDGEAVSVMDKKIGTFATVTMRGAQGIAALQLLSVLLTLLFGTGSIKRTLKPLDDIAKRADELTQIAFDESKYANLESAIEHLNPDEQDGMVRTGNKDLEGVEMAINNLLTRMRDSYRQQSRFVSDASHELRTPIAVIQGYANMLDRWGKEDEQVLDESIEAIKHESDHMKTLVEQLLFLARGDAGRNTMNMQEISLKSILKEVYEESCMIDENHIYELMEEPGDANADVVMTGDEAMLKQAMRILVDNAAKYTPEGETIKMRCGVNNEMMPYFMIQDSGIGMSESEVEHIFERFYRSDEARNRQTGGTGLGLSIAKWIFDKHNGYVDVLTRTDIGTRFTVKFRNN